jgi:DNA polymerase-3 subunit alpha
VDEATGNARLFADLPKRSRTRLVAQRCAVAAPKRKPILPSLAAGDREAESELKLRVDERAGLEARLDRPRRRARGELA